MTYKDLDQKANKKPIQDQAKEKAGDLKNKFDQKKADVSKNASNIKNAAHSKLEDDERIDQAGRESFPASDSAGYRSKQPADKSGSQHV